MELIADKDALKKFCQKHGALLEGKTVIYKPVEHWDVKAVDINPESPTPEVVEASHEKLVPA
ncbi:MAG: hypothetical protein ACLQVY_11185 [Limisphaerales bacterium]